MTHLEFIVAAYAVFVVFYLLDALLPALSLRRARRDIARRAAREDARRERGQGGAAPASSGASPE